MLSEKRRKLSRHGANAGDIEAHDGKESTGRAHPAFRLVGRAARFRAPLLFVAGVDGASGRELFEFEHSLSIGGRFEWSEEGITY